MERRDLLRLLAASAAGCALPAPTLAEVPTMLRRKIPKSGEAVPAVGLGTYRAFDLGRDDAAEWTAALEALRRFAEAGATLVDSSPMYGKAEAAIGDLCAELGLEGKLFLATKVWTEGRDAGVAQMESSLAKMRTKRLDLIQVHNLLDVEVHLKTLAAWKREGKVRYVGVTHWRDDAHDELARCLETHELDFVQLNYSARERAAEKRLLKVAADRGVAVIVNRPFGAGDLFKRAAGKPLPDWAKEVGAASWAQLFLKYVLSHPAVTCAIPASRKAAHVVDNVGAATGPLPDGEQRARIARLVDGL
jgi:diketogulonate reductase-like aldo/keto reductase